MRAALVEALPPHQTWCQTIGHFDCCGRTDDDCDCGITESLDELLPVVRHLAAEELRDLADRCVWVTSVTETEVVSVTDLYARAAALDPS